MSLLQTENKTVSASFEDDDATSASPSALAAAAATVANAAAAATVAVQVAQPTQLAVHAATMVNVLEPFKNALRVEYNTLESVIATNGNFVARESKKVLGDTITFELLSFQDSYVVSPNDDKAPGEDVRYSDDGITCSDGTSVEEHLQYLRTNGWPKAALKNRVVVVGAVESTAKPSDLEGTLVQFDLSPASRVHWNRYTANAAFLVKKGKYTAEQLTKVRATAELATSGTNTYTMARFAVA